MAMWVWQNALFQPPQFEDNINHKSAPPSYDDYHFDVKDIVGIDVDHLDADAIEMLTEHVTPTADDRRRTLRIDENTSSIH
jgi:hypothetical protein